LSHIDFCATIDYNFRKALNVQVKIMADYKKMYLTLVDEVTKTIDSLTGALQKAENTYIESDNPPEMIPHKKTQNEADAQ